MNEQAKKIDEWDYQYENEITCPYCGYKDRDSWEHNMQDGDTEETECGKCEKVFDVSCDVSVTYTSEPKQDGSDN